MTKAEDVEKALADAAWRVDCLLQRMDAAESAGAVNVARIVRRLMPGQSAGDVAKVAALVESRLTRGGRAGEVDAVAYINEYLDQERHRRRYGDAQRADAAARPVALMIVTKLAANRFSVTGVIAVVGGRQVNEPYTRVWPSKAQAERDADKWDRINKESLVDLETERQQRIAVANSYVESRKTRSSSQMSLF